jgi:uncharacterized protein (DUF885 family)
MGTITEIADRYTERLAGLDPVQATEVGIGGHDGELTDLSPAGFAARADLDRATIAELTAAGAATERDRVARDAMLERLGLAVERYDAGDTTSELNVAASWVQGIRQVFDLMPAGTQEAARDHAARLAAVPAAYAGLQETLAAAARAGRVAPARQVREVARQCAEWTAPGSDFYAGLVRRVGDGSSDALRSDLDRGAAAARAATAGLGAFLTRDLLPLAPEQDAAGREVYGRAARAFLGATVDLDEAYLWGWDEVLRIEAEMDRVAGQITGGGTVDDAVAVLDADPARVVRGRDRGKAWMQGVADQVIENLDGRHFDIPPPARRIEAMIAPTADGGIYYTNPSEDWTRPGQMWWSLPAGVDEFSTWREITTIHHEGAPGHHLQTAQVLYLSAELNRWQRMICWVSGHGEGWALYAERLMDELGYLSDPGDLMGLLDSQLLRAVRVVVDLGVHLSLRIPGDSRWRPGETWDARAAWEYLRARSQTSDAMLRYELNRYLGWPGQAPSYKLGERIWLQARADARARAGAAFDLKEFHTKALALGSIGLDPLREALSRL